MDGARLSWPGRVAQWPFRGGRTVPTLIRSNSVQDVPAVRDAAENGLTPIPENPMWCFLPAVWPTGDCYWTPDIRVRIMSVSCNDEPPTEIPWNAADYAAAEDDVNALLATCGISPRPFGRIWLVRTKHKAMDELTQELLESAAAAGIGAMASREFAEFTRTKLPVLLG